MVFVISSTINWLWRHDPIDAARHELIKSKKQLNSYMKRETAFKERENFWKKITNYVVLIICLILCSISILLFSKEQILMLIALLMSASVSIAIWNGIYALIAAYYRKNIAYTEDSIGDLLITMENLLIKLKQDTRYEQITRLVNEYNEWIKQIKERIENIGKISSILEQKELESVQSEDKHSNKRQVLQKLEKETNSKNDDKSKEEDKSKEGETELERKCRELKEKDVHLNEKELELEKKKDELKKKEDELKRRELQLSGDKSLLDGIKHSLSRGNKLIIPNKGSTDQLSQSSEKPYDEHFTKKYKMDVLATKFNGFWFERIVDRLMGYSPVNCLALICKQCRAHNGLISIEDGDQIQIFDCWSCGCTNLQLLRKEGKDNNDTSFKEKAAEAAHEQLEEKKKSENWKKSTKKIVNKKKKLLPLSIQHTAKKIT